MTQPLPGGIDVEPGSPVLRYLRSPLFLRDVLLVGEGIETCLSAMQATGHAAWAALSTSGLRNLDLPAELRDVIVLADGDDPGEAVAQECAWRWKREGRRVRIARPPAFVKDWADLALLGCKTGTDIGWLDWGEEWQRSTTAASG